jgi:hypothetical protein
LEVDVSSWVTGACGIDGAGVHAPGGASHAVTLSCLGRQALTIQGWYWSYGVQAEKYSFAGGQAWPQRLQDYTALLTLEYYEGAESVAALTIRPGWYFENHPSATAWDVPVDLTGGLPVTRDLSAVLGFSNGRFYHHALPILGLVWIASPRLRIELLYPEPALIVTLGPTANLRLGGELIGAGFLSDARPTRTAVEYTSYRVGAEWNQTLDSGLKLAFGAGVEVERSFDYFRRPQRLHGAGAGYLKISASYSH